MTNSNTITAPLDAIFEACKAQIATGKGAQRHGSSQPITEQPIYKGAEIFGPEALLFQAWKKTAETVRLQAMENGTERALNEIYGAINYLAVAALVIQGRSTDTTPQRPAATGLAGVPAGFC